jgi:hypothetical protein
MYVPSYLEETKLIGSLVRSDDQRFDVTDIDVAAGHSKSW